MKRLAAALVLAVAIAFCASPGAAAAGDFSDLALTPRAGAQLPLAARFLDEDGRPVTLGRYFDGKPVVLVLDYLHCKTLCGVALAHLMSALGELPLAAGRDYQVVSVSIDPRDKPADAAAAKAKYLALYGREGAETGVHFLIGAEAQARAVAEAIGFPYRYDAALDQYIHPAGFVLVAPDGRISRYVLAVVPSSTELEAGLRDAAASRAEDPLTRLLLLCHIEGAPLGRFDAPILVAFTLANLAAGATLIVVFGVIRRRRHG